MSAPITVRQLNLYARSLLDGDARLADVTVIGEISNFKNHYASGHWYFTLKDRDAALHCVMFKFANARVKFAVRDGMQILLRGRVSIYEKDGQFQLYAEEMQPAGAGDLALQFEQIKAKLSEEGMFDSQNKRPLPRFPKEIAVITSDTGAAVQDILNITARRYPLCRILLCPVAVQGENAVEQMTDALERVYRRGQSDLIIIGRGGGSVEDLWAFNSERLARKIYESPIPVISAVGHETDFTICDFVADLRAPTPSAAAEIAVPDKRELQNRIEHATAVLRHSLQHVYQTNASRFSAVVDHSLLQTPERFFEPRWNALERLSERLKIAINIKTKNETAALETLLLRLDALSPLKTMARGFSVVRKADKTITSVSHLQKGDPVSVRFYDGVADCIVEGVEHHAD